MTVATAPTGAVYVVDSNNNRVQIFNSCGVFQNSFGSAGSGNGQFSNPFGVAVGPTGTVYVTDEGNNRVEVFNSSGVFQSSFGSAGPGNGQFFGPGGIAVAPTGMVYVTDVGNTRVERFLTPPPGSAARTRSPIRRSDRLA